MIHLGLYRGQWVRHPAATALLTTQGFYDSTSSKAPSVPNLCCLEWLQVWPRFVGHDGGPPAVRPRPHRQRLVLGDCRDARPLRHCLVLGRVLSRYNTQYCLLETPWTNRKMDTQQYFCDIVPFCLSHINHTKCIGRSLNTGQKIGSQ